jgi:hypothetical protein
MKMPATARRPRITPSLYHDDALTDALAEARADAWARVGLTLGTGQRQLNNFRLLEIGAKTGAITATEPKHIAKRMDTFQFRARFCATQFCLQTTLRKQTLTRPNGGRVAGISTACST